MKSVTYESPVPSGRQWLLSIALATTVVTSICLGDTLWIHDPETPGDWHDPLNWSAGLPDCGTNTYVANNGEAQILSGEACAKMLGLGQSGFSGSVTQASGTLEVVENLFVGREGAPLSDYALGGGVLDVGASLKIGNEGDGIFEQTGGENFVSGEMCVACRAAPGQFHAIPVQGTYTLSGGYLAPATLVVGIQGGERQHEESTGRFYQAGGTNEVQGNLTLGSGWNTRAIYVLDVGELHVMGDERLGIEGRAELTQTGGVHTVSGSVFFGEQYENFYGLEFEGVLDLAGGTYSVAGDEHVGYLQGRGRVAQTGGVHSIAGVLRIGAGDEVGAYDLGGGSLEAGELQVGDSGLLHVTDPTASLQIGSGLVFANGSEFDAVLPTSVEMVNASLQLASTVAGDVRGLGETDFIFHGQIPSQLEVSGADLGALPEGLIDNFALCGLTIGDDQHSGSVQLVDLHDNQSEASPAEALYVHSLTVGPGSSLNLNGLHLYYAVGTIDPAATITLAGGSLIQVASPPSGDLDVDGDVDRSDFESFASCFTGPCADPPCSSAQYCHECCGRADFDQDGDVDLRDLARFQVEYNVP